MITSSSMTLKQCSPSVIMRVMLTNFYSIEKRKLDDKTGRKKEDVERDINHRGMALIQENQPSDNCMLQGTNTIITLDEIRRDLCMAEARLKCSQYRITGEVDTLVKILSELREYDLAVDLARLSKCSVAYPVMLMLKEYEPLIEENKIIDSEFRNRDETRWCARQKCFKSIDEEERDSFRNE